MNKLITEQYKYRRNPHKNAQYEHAIIILKPGYQNHHIREVLDFANTNGLEIVYKDSPLFNREAIIAIYTDIFRFDDKDLTFGIDWKKRKLEYMTSSKSAVFILKGEGSQTLSEQFKYILRDKYKKLSVPAKKLDNEEFDELAIKNLIHVVDEGYTEVALQLLIA